MDNPTPQAGIYNPLEPGILMVPRRPVNLFYNVTNPTEWTNEYNYLYHAYWGRDLTYSEILDKESDILLQYLLRGEVDPWMFHQNNLRGYDGVHLVLGDLLDRTLDKYGRIVTLPIRSMTMAQLGLWTKGRMQYNASGVQASFVPAQGTITLTATRAAVIPVTGLASGGAESYGGQWISHISLAAGQTVTMQFQTSTPTQTADVETPSAGLGQRVLIRDVRPNPVSQATTITLDVPHDAQARLVVYDVSGRAVRTLVNRTLEAGVHPIAWDGRSDVGEPVARGIYFAKLDSGRQSSTRRIVVIK